MRLLQSFGIPLSITLFRVFAVVQSVSPFNKHVDRELRSLENTTYQRLPGESCNASFFNWYPVEDDPRKFLYCDKRTGQLVQDMCATVNNVPKIFDERFQRCVMPALGKLRTPGVPRSSVFGEPCMYNTDCLDNMYCPNGICLCVSGFIDSNRACVPAVAPGQGRCSTDQECRAYWPTTRCTNGRCECVLPPDMVSDPTKPAQYGTTHYQSAEGWVCLVFRQDASPRFFCPLPIPYDVATTDTWEANTAGPAQFNNDDNVGLKCSGNGQPCVFGLPTSTDDWSDMAICIPKTSQDTPPTVAGANAWVCCPNRAHTCMQPRPLPTQVQPASPPVPATGETRYWYNPATGTCEGPLFWDGLQPFANNFKTRNHCMSYCGGICPRGNTQLTNGMPRTCSSTSACGSPTLTCQSVASAGRQLCCPTQASICSAAGGRWQAATGSGLVIDVSGIANAPQAAGVTPVPVDRFRYDPTTRSCVRITNPTLTPPRDGYTGWGGTYNNFATQQECQSFCIASACEQGEPLKDGNGGGNQACGQGCPSTYECRNNICCPKRQTVCIQPRRPGSCTLSLVRYWYNPVSRDCEEFRYTGCGGNDNNFESYQTCTTYCRNIKPEPQCIQGSADRSAGNYYTCAVSGTVSTCRTNYECYFDGYSFGCCPQRAYTCSLPSQSGSSCVTSTTRWYFDPTTRTCERFTYNGCDGNSNNFINQQECERYCGVGGCPYGGEPFREPSTGATRVCNAQVTCPSGYSCNTVGIGGSVLNYCCQTRAFICQQSPIQGTQCAAQLQRYYFNVATRQCTTFTYFGCGGNENNFATLSQCNNFCGSAACNAGEAAYIDPNSNRALTCNPAASNNCPSGYSCRSDTLTNSNICCGSNDMGVCPAGEKAYIEALTMSTRECQPSIASSCPNTFLCRPNSARNRYYCCGTNAANICPAGRAVYRSPDTNQPAACFVSTINQCPPEYSCQPTTAGQTQGYCCTINTICPNAGEFFLDPATQQPRRCTVAPPGGFNQCPTSYTCASNAILTTPPNTNGFCCRGGAGRSVCSNGQPDMVNGVPQQCTPNQPPFCPNGFACTASASGGGLFYCCSTASQDGCPPGTNAFVPTGTTTAQLCFGPADTTCPGGYNCQLSPTMSRYQCCTSNAGNDGCPPGMVVYREPGTAAPRVCTFGGNQCPSPYSCQTSTAGRLQCCALSGGCPPPMVAAINPTTGQPLVCTGGVSCPLNFQCVQATTGQMTCCGVGTSVIPTPMRARCPFPGQTAYVIPTSGQVQTCRRGLQTCPRDHDCLNGGDGFVCCSQRQTGGGMPAGACPLGSTVYTNPVTGEARDCANSFTRCPQPYQCRYSATLRNYYCCSVVNTGVVGAAFCWGICNPVIPNSCIQGYTCQTFGTQSVCCLTSALAVAQTSLSQPFRNPGPSQDDHQTECWGTCNPLQRNSCIQGYSCQYKGTRSFCCRDTATTALAQLSTPVLSQVQHRGQVSPLKADQNQCWGPCNPGLANSCVKGYSCKYVGARPLCCRNLAGTTVPQAIVPVPGIPPTQAQITQQPVSQNIGGQNQCWGSCNPSKGKNACIGAYTCRYVNGQYSCCRGTAASTPMAPAPVPAQAQARLASSSVYSGANSYRQSPVDTSRDKTPALRNLYRRIDENATALTNGGCAIGEAPYFPQGSPEPAECSMGIPPCPSGYSCTKHTSSDKMICCRPLVSSRQERAPGGGKLNAAINEEKDASEREAYSENGGQCWGTCRPGAANSCLRGYACQTFGTQSLCCRTTAGAGVTVNIQSRTRTLTGTSSSGGDCSPLTYPGTKSPLVCQRTSTGTGNCPDGYECTSAAGKNVCCPK